MRIELFLKSKLEIIRAQFQQVCVAGAPATDKFKPSDDPLRRTGKIFGGVFQDVGNRLKWLKSDFVDAFSWKCLLSAIFIFFAALVPAITFGGIMSKFFIFLFKKKKNAILN